MGVCLHSPRKRGDSSEVRWVISPLLLCSKQLRVAGITDAGPRFSRRVPVMAPGRALGSALLGSVTTWGGSLSCGRQGRPALCAARLLALHGRREQRGGPRAARAGLQTHEAGPAAVHHATSEWQHQAPSRSGGPTAARTLRRAPPERPGRRRQQCGLLVVFGAGLGADVRVRARRVRRAACTCVRVNMHVLVSS